MKETTTDIPGMINDDFGKLLSETIEKFEEAERTAEYEKALSLCEEYDFFVGSEEAKKQIESIFPKANVAITPNIVEPNKVVMIKKWTLDPNIMSISPYGLVEGGSEWN